MRKIMQHAPRLLTRVWAERKAHEIMICYEFDETLDVFFSKWSRINRGVSKISWLNKHGFRGSCDS